MIDFFHKGAAMTKRIEGVAKMEGAPVVHARPKVKVDRVGTFFNNGKPIAHILLEVADTEESRRKGLMGRKIIPSIFGMQFDGLSGGGFFWMKGCLAPIDVAFLDKDGLVTKTYAMKVDEEGESHYPYDAEDVSAVEVAGGMFEKWGIGPGFAFSAKDLAKEAAHG